jgi:N-acetylglucosamine transport system permease protein
MTKRNAQAVFAAACIMPGFLMVMLFLIVPTLQVFYYSLFDVSSMLKNPSFVGADNFKYLATDKVFLASLANTTFYMVFVPVLTLFLSIVLALIVTQGALREKGFYRVVFFFPSIVSMVVVAVLWSYMFHPTDGPVNKLLEAIGLGRFAIPWFGDAKGARWAIVVTMVWQAAGYYMVFYIAGIDRIPKELYEAAILDGANEVQKFFNLTVPFLWEIIRVTIIFAISGTISISYIMTTIMTGTGLGSSGLVLFGYMYRQAFFNNNFGYATSIAITVLAISFGLALVSNAITKRDTLEF